MKQEAPPIYKDPARTPEERTEDLLSRMTLEEKLAQISGVLVNNTPGVMLENMKKGIGQFGGSISADSIDEIIATVEQYIRWSVEESRLGIPAAMWGTCFAGAVLPDSTTYPPADAQGSTWDPELIRDVYRQITEEMRAAGHSLICSPMVDLARDPRWGANSCIFSEDPTLSAAMGFTPDLSSVTPECEAIKQVIEAYRPQLYTGTADPDELIPEMLESMKEAGLDKVIDEIQRQLDAFLAGWRSTGLPPVQLKAVLTPTNRSWPPALLQAQLAQEAAAFRSKKG